MSTDERYFKLASGATEGASSANLRRRAEDTSEFQVILEMWNRQIGLVRQAATGGIERNTIAG
jgi:hypothetical protein